MLDGLHTYIILSSAFDTRYLLEVASVLQALVLVAKKEAASNNTGGV